ncbi:MAG: tRNA (5-methylaminomethyl-2-thiouridine)(34)-methyltransferase MnmD [Pseudomonadota bacterium]
MTTSDDQDSVVWRNGVPVSRRFDDPYFALSDGLKETRHVFLAGNLLQERWDKTSAFQIAELGFGTGLNFLASLALWRQIAPIGARLKFTSFELYPLSQAEMAAALEPWPDLPSDDLVPHWPLNGPLELQDCVLEVVLGDARQTLPTWKGQADAWFLDGFAPARNPQLWQPDLLRRVAEHTMPGGTFATYSAAGHVRRSLQAAGFTVERRPGYGGKRHMSVGRLAN